jgi:hypothetical protein
MERLSIQKMHQKENIESEFKKRQKAIEKKALMRQKLVRVRQKILNMKPKKLEIPASQLSKYEARAKTKESTKTLQKAKFYDILDDMDPNYVSNTNERNRDTKVNNWFETLKAKEGDILYIGVPGGDRAEYGYAIVGKGGFTFNRIGEAFYGPCLHLSNNNSLLQCISTVCKNEAKRFKIPKKDYTECSKQILKHFKLMRFL